MRNRSVPNAHVELMPPDRSGFLSEEESAGLFEADLYLAAMARSGSTLLCTLMTFSPDHLCMNEPWFMYGARSEALRKQFERIGISVTLDDWSRNASDRHHYKFLKRYRDLIAPILARMTRWGAKEVRPELHEPTIRMLRPKRSGIVVRDIRQIAFSLYDKHRREGDSKEAARNFASGYIPHAADTLVALRRSTPEENVSVIRYEDFSASPAAIQALSSELNWPLLGTPNAGFDALDRVEEAARHGGRVSPARGYDETALPRKVVALADQLAEACGDYQHTFGYA